MYLPVMVCDFRYVVLLFRKVLKEISVGDIKPDETVDAVKEARLLAKVLCVDITASRELEPPAAR